MQPVRQQLRGRRARPEPASAGQQHRHHRKRPRQQPQGRRRAQPYSPGGAQGGPTIYIRDEDGGVAAIFAINYDITGLLAIEGSLRPLISTGSPEAGASEPESIPLNVNDLLDELISQSIKLVGKPVAMMNKDDKIKAIQFLNSAGAFLITKSGDKVSKQFGISKYTLYNYMDASRSE